MSFSLRGCVGSTLRPASGSRLDWRGSTVTHPFCASARMVEEEVLNSLTSCCIQPPPTRTMSARSSDWCFVSGASSSRAAAGSTNNISFGRADGFSTDAGTAVFSTISIGVAVYDAIHLTSFSSSAEKNGDSSSIAMTGFVANAGGASESESAKPRVTRP